MITGIHHINFLVRDLDAAIARYEALLDGAQFDIAELTERGVKTAKVKLGDTWLVLVQPLDELGIPAQHLAEHGEGFFLMSLQTDHLEQQVQCCIAAGIPPTSAVRSGLDNWRVVDFSADNFFGASLQLTEVV